MRGGRGGLGHLLGVAIGAGLAAVLALLASALAHSRLLDPPPSRLYLDRRGHFLALVGEGPQGELGYWPVDPPPRVVRATVALEDRRFAYHWGVDPLAVARAAWQNLTAGRRVSGASTLAMQVARLQHPGPRTLGRKLREAVTARLLTARYGRRAILAQYLRLAPYGNRIRGIGLAARFYLDKPVEDLSWAEIAYLVAIPQAPSLMNPYRLEGHRRVQARAGRLLDELARQGVITPGEDELARAQLAAMAWPRRPRRPPSTLHLAVQWEREFRRGRGHQGDPLVVTTLDLELQEELQWSLAQQLATDDPGGVANAAVVVVALPGREVLAAVGSAGYFDGRRAGAFDYTALPRSPGSSLKPFLYALALERGRLTPATILDDLHPAFGVHNADHAFLGPLLPAQALACSRNVPAVNLLVRLGLSQTLYFLQQVGAVEGSVRPGKVGVSLAVGGVPTTLRRLVGAYTYLAGDGEGGELVWQRGVPSPGQRLLGVTPARQVTAFLSDPQARLPSFPRLGPTEFPFPVAVKTGTSPGGRDGWTVAYSRRFVVGAWVGRGDWRPQAELTGYTSAARLVRGVLAELHGEEGEGFADLSSPPPPDHRRVRLCAHTARLAGAGCFRVFDVWLAEADTPRETCAAHRRVAVDRRTGRQAGAAVAGLFREERPVLLLPPRYAAWLTQQGLAPPLPASLSQGAHHPELGSVLARPPRLRILFPHDGARLLPDPEAPPGASSLRLQAAVDPPVPEVLWLLNGQPLALASYPYAVRWPLVAGQHQLEAVIPFTPIRSPAVRVWVGELGPSPAMTGGGALGGEELGGLGR